MQLESILEKARTISQTVLKEEAGQIDQHYHWPEQTMHELQRQGLMGLVAPKSAGGSGQGLYGLARTSEVLAQVSASAGLCFGMHCVGTAVIASKATAYQKKNFLEPICAGEHITTLALSEPGTGAHFYFPQTKLLPLSENEFEVNGKKTFVTNGSKADSYVVSTMGIEPDAYVHEFSCMVVEKEREGLVWGPEWTGLGMRGNSSRSLELNQVKVPAQNLLGERGEQLWYIFQVVAPFFLTAMSGTYLGLAQAALTEATNHIKSRIYQHSGTSLSQAAVVQHRLGMLWAKVERTRQLIYYAALQGDQQGDAAVPAILSAKAEVAHCATDVVNEAMTLCGGIAYRENSRFDVLLRDARAAHVMAPTTDILYTWLGRALLEQPILDA